MLIAMLTHDGARLGPHDMAASWHVDPIVIVSIAVALWIYRRGWHPVGDGRRALAFVAGCSVVGIALLSPVDALAGVLLTGHMIQHVLLVSIAAPLLAWSAPAAAVARGAPRIVRTRFAGLRRATGLDAATIRTLRTPLLRWSALVAAVWVWHAPPLYGAAIDNSVVHALEHLSFLGAAWLFWTMILGPRRQRVSPGFAVLGLFTLGLQNVVLSMLMTFSTFPWYEAYAEPAPGWSIDPLTDQQLAGVVMWLPSGLVTAGVAIAVLLRWLEQIEASDDRLCDDADVSARQRWSTLDS